MKKRSLLVSLVLALGLPFGLVASAGPAAAQACYVRDSNGNYEEAPNFLDPYSCETMAGGVWI